MFKKLRKALSGSTLENASDEKSDHTAEDADVASATSAWALARGLPLVLDSGSRNFLMSGELAGKSLKLERGPASREYIHGAELRGRAEIAPKQGVTILIMNRLLKEELEKRAYSLYTDTLETKASPALTEEMRWLALYPEVGWDALSDDFCGRYAVMTDSRAHAMRWIEPAFQDLLTAWPDPPPAKSLPFIFALMRGKANLRMQMAPADLPEERPLLEHAARVFVAGSAAAIGAFSGETQDF